MKLFSCLWVLLGVTNLWAQNVGDIFGGLTYTQVSIKDESSTKLGTFNPPVTGLGLAYVVVDHLALEASVFDGNSDSSLPSARGGIVTVKIKNGYGMGLRPFIALNESWGAYAKLGRQYGTQSLTVPTIRNRALVQLTTDSTYARTVYGLGISYNINPRWGISSEYVWSIKGQSETNKNNSVSLGLRYKF